MSRTQYLSTWTEILAWFSLGAQASRLLRKAAKMAAFPGYKLQEHKGINIMSGYLAMRYLCHGSIERLRCFCHIGLAMHQ
jgi:hypothetical protein